ncbi:MAG: ATPase [Eubacterium sp.]|nr:ATPase [Eubacterium sp.]
MNRKIEQIVDEMEEYISTCKTQLFNESNIVVDKGRIDDLMSELRHNLPEELRQYEKIIRNRDAIIADARAKADEMLAKTQIHTSELVSEHEIMQQAYAQANEVVVAAKQQAQDIVDNAIRDANEIRDGAISYTDDLLKNMEEILSRSIDTTQARTERLLESLQEYLGIVMTNRAELVPQEMISEEMEQIPGQNTADEQVELNIPYLANDSDQQ